MDFYFSFPNYHELTPSFDKQKHSERLRCPTNALQNQVKVLDSSGTKARLFNVLPTDKCLKVMVCRVTFLGSKSPDLVTD